MDRLTLKKISVCGIIILCSSVIFSPNPSDLFASQPADMVDAEESDSEESDEYLAFEFFFDLTAQYHAPRIKMEYDDPSLDNFEEKLGEERSPKPFFEKTRALLDYKNNSFNLFVDWSMIGDERYDPPKASPRYR